MKNVVKSIPVLLFVTLITYTPIAHAGMLSTARRCVTKTCVRTQSTAVQARHFSDIPKIHHVIAAGDVNELYRVIWDNSASVRQRLEPLNHEKFRASPAWYQSYPWYEYHMPLTHAAHRGNIKMAKLLIDNGAPVVESMIKHENPEARKQWHCSPALIEAVKQGDISMAILLIKAGAITNNGYFYGKKPADIARDNAERYSAIAELLHKSVQK